MTLPPALLARLARAPRLVVAPVGVGYGQEALLAWAQAQGRRVLRDPSGVDERPALLLCARRSDLARLGSRATLAETLVLEEADALIPLESWRAALKGLPERFVEASFAAAEGWPAGLELAERIGGSQLPLHRHPLAALALERLLPEGEARQAAEVAAATPLLLGAMQERLGLSAAAADELLDRGVLRPAAGGAALPRLLRRYLCPNPDPQLSRWVASELAQRRHLAEALTALLEAELWEEYLQLLAARFEPHGAAAEARLRQALVDLPASLHAHPAYLYLLGVLERLRGELPAARERLRLARRAADGSLRARIDNARGVAFALQGDLEAALKAFAGAVRTAGEARLEGEARHNRAGVYVQQGRFEEAEGDLRRAIALFRGSAEYVREARSLQLLALGYHQRGLLREARQGYEQALELLGTLSQPTALLRANLAEVLLLCGQLDEAEAELERAEEGAAFEPRARGYLQANRAMLLLARGRPAEALRALQALLRHEGLEANLAAEARLLLARGRRALGDLEGALSAAQACAGLGLRAELERALAAGEDLSGVVEGARREEARFELATALLHRGKEQDLEEALELIRTHGYRLLLDDPQHAPRLAALAQGDPARLALFPMQLQAFGSFRVLFLGSERTLSSFPTRKSAALLLRLALTPHALSREALAEEFWWDAGNPLQSLQTALYHLSRTLGVQVAGGSKGQIELLYPATVDISRFEERAERVLAAEWPRAEEVRQVLEGAAGEPLSDFPEWFEVPRRRLEALTLRLWRRLAELEAAQPRQAAEALSSLLRLDPYDVDSRRRLIHIYSVLGDSEQARHEAERLRVIESEL